MSAIVTNEAIEGGDDYYLIGRALRPEVGINMNFVGNAIASIFLK
jgi:hypothetical protein